MLAETICNEIQKVRIFFNNTIRVLDENDSGFKPQDEMYTVAQQIAHVAHTIDWFNDSAFSEEGPTWNDDVMKEHETKMMGYTSLTEAKKWLEESFDRAIENFGSRSDEELTSLTPETSLMGANPRFLNAFGIQDHTAHHRGSLGVYVRLIGKTPPIPYMPE
jgi:uncharacterized damage-inducible protein DinB